MAASIPASEIVNIVPGVIGAGGTGLDLSGLILTDSVRAPMGMVLRFSTALAVSDYFGATSPEATQAGIYFRSYRNSFAVPAALLFAPYASAARAGWLRGAALGLTLTQLKALSGNLTITFGVTALTSSAINLNAATSFSNAAALLQAGFTSPPFAVTYDSVADAFLFTSTATGVAATIVQAGGTLATPLKLTTATGATLSQGAAASTPASAMDTVYDNTQNFASFSTLFKLTDAQLLDFARWNNGKSNRFLYVGWTDSAPATTNNDTSSPGYLVRAEDLSGTSLLWSPVADKATARMSYVASLDFNRTNGRTVAAFRTFSGLLPDVTSQTIAANLIANGYDFYGSYATANEEFTWFYNGQVTGEFAWVDSYVNQIWMNAQFQLDLMVTLGAIGQIPYNDEGYELLRASLLTTIETAVSYGAIRAGVSLTEAQRAIIVGIVGRDVSDAIFNVGWFLSIQDPGAAVRAARGSPIMSFIYTDGGSVQTIRLSSLMVQ
jgi:hypothetical protein